MRFHRNFLSIQFLGEEIVHFGNLTTFSNSYSNKLSLGIVGLAKYEFNFGLFLEAFYNYRIAVQPYQNIGIGEDP